MSDDIAIFQIRVSNDLKKAIRVLAAHEEITIQSLIERVLVSFIEYSKKTQNIKFVPTLKGSGSLTSYGVSSGLIDEIKRISLFNAVSSRVVFYTALLRYFDKEDTLNDQ